MTDAGHSAQHQGARSSPAQRDFSARICATRSSPTASDVVGLDNFLTGRKANIAHLSAIQPSRWCGTTCGSPFWGEFDLICHLACPASPPFYQLNAIATAKVSFLGSLNMLGLAKRTRRPHRLRLDLRGLRRSARAPAEGNLLGQRQSDRPARLLRRGQAHRRGAVLRLPPTARARHQGRPHFQHLRPADEPGRRPRRLEFHRAGAQEPGHHHLRRRQCRRARSATSMISLRGSPCSSMRHAISPARSISAIPMSARSSNSPVSL